MKPGDLINNEEDWPFVAVDGWHRFTIPAGAPLMVVLPEPPVSEFDRTISPFIADDDRTVYLYAGQLVRRARRCWKATWSLESSQDIRAYHSLDAEMELARNIAKEIDLQILDDLSKK